MVKFIAIVLCAILGFSAVANGDAITLRKVNKNIELKVAGITDKYINVVISKKAIKSLNIRFFNADEYPDLIFLNVANAAIECKVKGVTGESVQALIPTTAISSLQVSFQSDDKQNKIIPAETPQATDITSEEKEITPIEAEVQEPQESEKEVVMESKIADKIRINTEEKSGKDYRLRTKKKEMKNLTDKGGISGAEIEGGHAAGENENEQPQEESVGMPLTNQTSESDFTKSGLSKTGVEEGRLNEDKKIQEEGGETAIPDQKSANDTSGKDRIKPVAEDLKKEKLLDPNLGRAEGKILSGGKPLPNCQVKLQMLEKYGLITKRYRPIEGAMEFETTTDEEGIYRFVNMAAGLYKLYWKPLSESMWVRRFKMEPDVIIESGKLTPNKDIETLKRTLN